MEPLGRSHDCELLRTSWVPGWGKPQWQGTPPISFSIKTGERPRDGTGTYEGLTHTPRHRGTGPRDKLLEDGPQVQGTCPPTGESYQGVESFTSETGPYIFYSVDQIKDVGRAGIPKVDRLKKNRAKRNKNNTTNISSKKTFDTTNKTNKTNNTSRVTTGPPGRDPMGSPCVEGILDAEPTPLFPVTNEDLRGTR